MIDPQTINRGDKFKVTVRNGLYDLDIYQTRLGTSLKDQEGWKKANGNLMTRIEHQQASFSLPAIKDGLSLPSITEVGDLIKYLEPGAEIETIQVLYHTDKAASTNTTNKDKAFQCLLVSTEIGDEIKYGFIWTTHASIDYAELIQEEEQHEEQEEPPTPDPIIDQEEIKGQNVEVYAGQTVVLDIKTSGQSEGPGTGNFEITLVNAEGEPIAPEPIVFLASQDGGTIHKVAIDIDPNSVGFGTGKLEGIKVGTYNLSLDPPIPLPPGEELTPVKWEENIYFNEGDYGISTSGALVLEKVAKHVAEDSGVREVNCIGYTDNIGSDVANMNLSIQRGASVRKLLKEKLDATMLMTTRQKPEIKSTGKGESGEAKENRKVEVWVESRRNAMARANTPLPYTIPSGCKTNAVRKEYPYGIYRIGGTFHNGDMVSNQCIQFGEKINLRLWLDLKKYAEGTDQYTLYQLLNLFKTSTANTISLGCGGKLFIQFEPPVLYTGYSENFPNIGEFASGENWSKKCGNELIIKKSSGAASRITEFELDRKLDTIQLPVSLPMDVEVIEESLEVGKTYRWIELFDLTNPASPGSDDKDYPGLDVSKIEVEITEYSREVIILLDISGSMTDDIAGTKYRSNDLAVADNIEDSLYFIAANALKQLIPDNQIKENTLSFIHFREKREKIITEIDNIKSNDEYAKEYDFFVEVLKHDLLEKYHLFTHKTPLKSAIITAAKKLNASDKECRLMIVVTDGDGADKETLADLKKEIPTATKNSAIELIGFHVFDDADIGTGKSIETDKLKNRIKEYKLNASSNWAINTHMVGTEENLLKVLKGIRDRYQIR